MEHKKANKLIKKILDDLEHAGIIFNTLSHQLKDLRVFAVEEELPVVAKALRLAYEHLEEFETFVAPIPEDEAFEGEEVTKISGSESMVYFINLIKNQHNPLNVEELREYIQFMEDFVA